MNEWTAERIQSIFREWCRGRGLDSATYEAKAQFTIAVGTTTPTIYQWLREPVSRPIPVYRRVLERMERGEYPDEGKGEGS